MLSAAGVQVHIMIIILNFQHLVSLERCFSIGGFFERMRKKERKERPAPGKSSYETNIWCRHILKNLTFVFHFDVISVNHLLHTSLSQNTLPSNNCCILQIVVLFTFRFQIISSSKCSIAMVQKSLD